jgi:hypothetical protein
MISARKQATHPGARLPREPARIGRCWARVCGVAPVRAAWVASLFFGAILVATPAVRAEHARIDLRVSGQGNEARASADRDPPPGGLNDPPVLDVAVEQPLVLQFILTNKYPHGVLEHVTVRYYVVRVAKLGRKPAPSLRESTSPSTKPPAILEDGIVLKGQFSLNFKPDCRVGTRLKFRIAQPGLYSARVETLNTQSDHEHFSAIDLVAK